MSIRILLIGVSTILLSDIASALVIDNFGDGDLSLTAFSLSGETAIQGGLDTSSVVGGVRRAHAGTLSGGNATLDIDSTGELFEFHAVSSFGYFNLAYGTEAPLHVDLSADGADAFELDFTHVTPGLFRGTYSMNLGSSSGSAVRYFAQELFALNGPGIVRIPFSDFPNVDFTEVLEISVNAVRVEPGYEISLGSIRTVPEPASACIVALAIVGVCLKRHTSCITRRCS
ncbi:MAG: hypothetical protein KDA57_10980 [Planctomycetales bacterium]|nr:hypothetical protein [Planctomycetales bacterium]